MSYLAFRLDAQLDYPVGLEVSENDNPGMINDRRRPRVLTKGEPSASFRGTNSFIISAIEWISKEFRVILAFLGKEVKERSKVERYPDER